MSQFDKLEKLGEGLLSELEKKLRNENALRSLSPYPPQDKFGILAIRNVALYAKIANFVNLAEKSIPNDTFLKTAWMNWQIGGGDTEEAVAIVKHTMELIGFEKEIRAKIEAGKLFDTAHDKLEQATKIFQEGDEKKYPSVLDSLNSALELMLKDKLEIPVTLTNVNTAKIVDILVSNNIGPTMYLSEAKRHISSIDNQTKHEAYRPTKVDCIKALKAAIDLETKLKNVEIKLNDEVRNKIYAGIQFTTSER